MQPMVQSEADAKRAVQQTLAAIFPTEGHSFDWRESYPIQRAKEAIDKGHSVLLVGGGPELRLTRDAFSAWLDQLPARLPISLAGDVATTDQAEGGIGWVLRLGSPGEEIAFSDLPADDPFRAMMDPEDLKRK